ncbi:MAG: hypothetical protein D6802_07655 [Ardenticatenia bacterium]|nr:MAG: hypothetical protein D6802_07655 [Ardenticatenia bacterium]
MVLLRLIHILSAIFWMGSTLFIGLILEPAVAAAGPEGSKFMQKLAAGPLSRMMSITGMLTILSGLGMYISFSGGFDPTVMFSTRLPLTLGALAGLGALLVGMVVQAPATKQLNALGEQIASQGGTPTPEQMAQIAALQRRLRHGGRLDVILMLLAVLGMVA